MTWQTLGWPRALGGADLDVSNAWITAIQGVQSSLGPRPHTQDSLTVVSPSRCGCHLLVVGGCCDLPGEREVRDPLVAETLDWPWGWPLLLPVFPATSAGQLSSLGMGRAGSSEAARPGHRMCSHLPRGGDSPSLGRFSVDEGLTWSTHNFTSTSVFVDGLLSEPGDETLVMT